MNLLPKDEKFFDMFGRHAEVTCQAAKLLLTGLANGYEGVSKACSQIEALERTGDEITHDIFSRLQSTFITPFDPEDIQTLATALDDVLDLIEDVSFRIAAYRLDPVPPPAVELGQIINDSCRFLARALEALRHRRSVIEDCVEVNRLENQADEVERTLVRNLFASDIDPITLIKQKEIYERLEETTDRCEDVSDVIQNIAIKNS